MICVMSLWRNDEARRLAARIHHLRSKTSLTDAIHWLWVVGDSDDGTEDALREFDGEQTTVIRADSFMPGDTIEDRRRRLGWTATEMFRAIPKEAEYVVLHESDIVSPADVIDQLLANPLPCAGWPIIKLRGQELLYDIWAYRAPTGECLSAHMPRPRKRFELGSFGEVWAAPAHLVRGRVIGEECIVDLCKQWRSEGIKLWCDPTIVVEQPVALWEA